MSLSGDGASDSLLNSGNQIARQSLNESRVDEDKKTNIVKKTCLRVLNDPFYFMLLHVSNLIVLNAFLIIDVRFKG